MIIVWLKGMNSQFFAENFPALLTQSLLWIQAITFLFIYLFVLFNVVLFVLYNSNPTIQLKVPQTQIQKEKKKKKS